VYIKAYVGKYLSIKDNNEILVTVLVVSYNSAYTILETLNSISRQDYPRICLVIADDCSTDDTVERASIWIESNKTRFSSVEITVTKKNSGVAINCNNGLKKATGKYLKLIAGDDILLPGCLTDFVNFCELNDCKIVFSDAEIISDLSSNHPVIANVRNYFDEAGRFLNSDYQWQKRKIFERNYLAAPTAFFSLSLLLYFHGFDRRFFMEDYPFWLKLYSADIKPAYLEKKLVGYRMHSLQSTSAWNKKLINDKFLKQEFLLFIFIQRKVYSLEHLVLKLLDYSVKFMFVFCGNKPYFDWTYGKYRSVYYKLDKMLSRQKN